MSRQPRGRRPGRSDTKERIASAARRQFADRGFAKTTLRTIADEAGVDTRLVSHYYGSKQQLFMAVVSLPLDADAVFTCLAEVPRERLGEALAAQFVQVVEDERQGEILTGLLAAASSEDAAADTLRGLLRDHVWTPLLSRLDVSEPQLRAEMVGTVASGYLFSRRVVGFEGVASASASTLVGAMGPMFQHALCGDWVPPVAAHDGDIPRCVGLPAPTSQLNP